MHTLHMCTGTMYLTSELHKKCNKEKYKIYIILFLRCPLGSLLSHVILTSVVCGYLLISNVFLASLENLAAIPEPQYMLNTHLEYEID